MPELPEVETTRRGIAPYLVGAVVSAVVIRQPRLRLPVSEELAQRLPGQVIEAVERRAKYLLLRTARGTVIVHLGMSGSLRLAPCTTAAQTHDHLDLCLSDGNCLRLRDPRRFGVVLWWEEDPLTHPLLAALGPEPLTSACDGAYLYGRSRGRSLAIKPFLMDSRVLAGVGNIYANEALFQAGIHPLRAAGRVGEARYTTLAAALKTVLAAAIDQGGTTLRDFRDSAGRPGYFQLKLHVYGRGGEPCPRCALAISQVRQGQRSTFYCAHCQR